MVVNKKRSGNEDAMANKIPLVIATGNPGKITEIKELLADFPIEVKSLNDFGPTPEVEEDGKTFDENAYKKASFTAKILGIPALADDSGLVVEALDGAPGVLSARYAGENATDEQRVAKLLKEMAGETDRRASFECVLSIAVPSGPALTYEARCEGLIAQEPAGKKGFGYDPIFFYPPLNKTFGQMTIAEKGKVSHRGKALQELKTEFDKVLIWIHRHMPLEEKFLYNQNREE
jgi:XTP/dITP diphosphohydrolase